MEIHRNCMIKRTERIQRRASKFILDLPFISGTHSDWLPVTSGVPQGSILGPLLCLVYINDMPEYVGQGSSIALPADDSKLYRPINSASHHLLQSDLSGLQNWSNDWGMTFNPSKCKVMHMSRKKVCSSASLQYHLNDKPLESVTNISDLGVIVSKDLSWANHIEDICTKANKTLGLIKRVCARDVVDANTRKLLYCAVVRPKLEYASCVWSPYSAKQRKLIENIQRRATKFILNYPPRDVTYRDRLISLQSPTWTQAWTLWPNTIIQNQIQVYNLINVTFNHYLTPATNPYSTCKFAPNNYNIIVSNNQ
jgi:hypothetical protein